MANQSIEHPPLKLLVTGGAGFIGSNFIHYWLAQYPQDSIVNLDLLTYAGNLANLTSVESLPNYQFIQGDICDPMVVDSAMTDVDIVVHFAAESHVDRSIMDPDTFLKTNVLGTHTLLQSGLKHNIKRFHHISTDEVFGTLELGRHDQFSETTAYDPRSPYSASKAGSDHLVRAYGETYGLPYSITNCSNNYGEYQFPEKLIALTITNLIEGKKAPVYGDGLQVRDWLYVKDHCRAIELVLLKGQDMTTYVVGGLTQDVSNLEVVKQIVKLMGLDESSIEYVTDRPGHDRCYSVNWSKIKNELGWQSSVNLEEGLKKTVDWYRAHPEWWQPLKEKNQVYFTKQYAGGIQE
ncbi:dTDP-glucose 4,6-dehydratase [Patescibacteria group bacterium]|nr:dTDP-glucose 4,6-dehydratase [Patescibacteria group bacterium]